MVYTANGITTKQCCYTLHTIAVTSSEEIIKVFKIEDDALCCKYTFIKRYYFSSLLISNCLLSILLMVYDFHNWSPLLIASELHGLPYPLAIMIH